MPSLFCRIMSSLALCGLPVLTGLTACVAALAAEPVVLLDETFQSADRWTLELRDGATGQMRVVDGQGLVIEKTNGLGVIVVRPTAPIPVQADTLYRLEARYHSDDAPLGNLFLLRAARDTQRIAYDAIDRSHGWLGNSLVVNTPPGKTDLRRITHKPTEAGDVWPMMVLHGNPMTLAVHELKLFSEKERITPNKGPALTTPMPRAALLAKLADQPASQASIERHRGQLTLMVDGKPIAPSFYRPSPYDNQRADYTAFRADGVTILSVPFKLGQNRDGQGIWQGPGQYDFTHLEKQLDHALGQAPDAHIVLDLMAYPYLGWGDGRLEECWTNADGLPGYGQWANLTGFTDDLAKVDKPGLRHWYYPSYHSQAWRQESAQAVRAVVAHLKTTPYWNRIIGLMIMGGHDGTFQVGFRFDYAPAGQAGFRQWCAQRYGDIAALNRAWGTNLARFDDVRIPQQGDGGSQVEADQPYIASGAVMDYRRFQSHSAWSLRDAYAQAFKEAAGKPVVTIAYTGGRAQETSWPATTTKHLDAAGTMSYYPWRKPGLAPSFQPPDTLANHGKLFFQELDLRSWVGSLYTGAYNDFINGGMDPQSWDAIHRKLVGISLAAGTGWWYYDMGLYFNDPAMHKLIQPVQALAQKLAEQPAQPRLAPQVAIVHPTRGMEHVSAYYSALKFGAQYQQMHLESAGVPTHSVFLDDLAGDVEALQACRMIVFMNCGVISPQQRQWIDTHLKRDGRWLVWLHESGYLGASGDALHAMSQLIGMTVRTQPGYGRLTAQLAADAPPALARGVGPYVGMAETMLTIMSVTGRSSLTARYQPFWIEDARVTPLLRYHPDGRLAGALRRFEDWTSVYLAAPHALSDTLLHRLASEAGALVVGEPGQSLHTDGRFVSIHGLRNGPYTLTLPPGRSRVTDALTGRELARDVSRFTLTIEAGQTYWLLLD